MHQMHGKYACSSVRKLISHSPVWATTGGMVQKMK
jgi:hypothetical protein